MRLLVLGYSSIAERRVIPAAGEVAAIGEISIASKSRKEPDADWPKRGRFFSDYHHALNESGADAVYLSLPNALHEEWVHAALAAGKHVIVDKPALVSEEASKRAVVAARQAGLLLAEATVFTYHPHLDRLLAFVREVGPLTHVDAQFIIPPLPISNFRNHPDLGGGCLLDMGPYAAGLVRLFGNGAPEGVQAFAGGRHPETGVDMGFSLLARLGNGALLSGQFSFEGEYQNRVIVVARSGSVVTERLFSLPANQKVVWQRRIRNTEDQVTFEPADSFARFLDAASHAIASRSYESFYRDLLADAAFRARLSEALATRQ
jgi:dTDP-3,4-didehydro-2,6-dideoxy-alpha-D-glucose 3-reductase